MDIWDKYERSKQYLDDHNIIHQADTNWAFYLGDQWRGLKTASKDKPPIYNFIKKNVKYKVGTICQNRQTAHYTTTLADAEDACQALDREYQKRWSKGKLDTKTWDMAKASAIQGDSYMFWGTSEFSEAQILPNTCVLLSDEQTENIQDQKYIIIRERLFVKDVQKAALMNGCDPSKVDMITGDDDTEYQIGNSEDVRSNGTDGKVTAIVYMEKKDGVVHVAKAVRNLVYEPLEPLATKTIDVNGNETISDGMKLYPIVNMVWETLPNSARGSSAVAEMIPNQIEVNKTLYRRVLSTKLSAFPRLAYNVDAVQNAGDINKVGAAIALRNMGASSISQLISYLPPQAMSQDAKTLNDDLLDKTTALSGSDDAITGTTDLARVASSTVLAVKDQQALNLNENVAKIKKLYEDIARIWFDQLRVYNPNGITIESKTIDGDTLRRLEPEIEINVTQDTVWSRDNEQTFWDNALEKQYVTWEEYCKNIPEGGNVPKDKLLKLLDAREKDKELTQVAEEIYDSGNNEMPEVRQ